MVRVRLIGPPRIEGPDGELREVRGQKPWAVLARVLLADRPLSRRELSAEVFPDADDPLGSLRWCLAALRKAFGSAQLFTGDPILRELPLGATVDVDDLRAGFLDEATVGELLEGIDPPCSVDFATWLLVARQHVAARIAAALREATITALSREQHERAIRLAQLSIRQSPHDEGAHVLLVKSLVAAGSADLALRHVLHVETLFRDQLGCEPSPALRSAARSSIAAEPPGVSASVVASSLLDAGRAAVAAGAIEAGLDCLRRAGSQAESSHDTALLSRCLYELGTALVHAVRGFDDEGAVVLGQAVELARQAGDLTTAVSALRERGYADALAGRRPQAQHHLDTAYELAGADADPRLLAGIHAVAGFNLTDWGNLTDGVARYEEAIALAGGCGDQRRQAWALGLGGWALLGHGRGAEAIRWLTRCLAIVRDIQWISFEPFPVATLAEARLANDEDCAPGTLEHCFAMSCQLEDPCWEGASGRVLALHHARTGDLDQALRWITDARVRCVRRPDTWAGLHAAILQTETRIRTAAGDAAGATAAARDLVALAARTYLDDHLPGSLALLTGGAGRSDRA